MENIQPAVTETETESVVTPEVPEITTTVSEQQVQDQVQDQDPPSKKLWEGLVKQKLYTKSFDEFQNKYSTKESLDFLYDGLKKQELYTKTRDDFENQYFPEIKKKASVTVSKDGSAGVSDVTTSTVETPEVTTTTTEETTVPVPEVPKEKPLDYNAIKGIRDIALLEKKNHLVKVNFATGTKKDVSNPEVQKKIWAKSDELKKAGIDVDKLTKDWSDFPAERFSDEALTTLSGYYNMGESERANRLKAAMTYQVGIEDAINNKINQNYPDATPDWYAFQKLMSDKAGKDKDYASTRNDVTKIMGFIDKYVDDDKMKTKLKNLVGVEYATAYGNPDKVGKSEYLKNNPNAQYFNNYQLAAYDYMKDTNPSYASKFDQILVSKPTDADAELAWEEKSKELEQIGIGLEMNLTIEQLKRIKYKLENTSLSPEEYNSNYNSFVEYQKRYNQLLADTKTLNSKYKNITFYDEDKIASDLSGYQYLTGVDYAGYKTGLGFESALEAVPELSKQMALELPKINDFRDIIGWTEGNVQWYTEQEKNLDKLTAAGKSIREESMTYKPTSSQLYQTYEIQLSGELKKLAEPIINNTKLTPKQKYDQLLPLVYKYPDDYARVPIIGGKINVSPSALLYGATDLATVVVPFIFTEAVTGGVGGGAQASKFMSTFNAAMATGMNENYKAAAREGVENPYAYALVSTGFDALAMAGIGSVEKIKKIFTPDTQIGKIIAGMDDKAIEKIAKNSAKSKLSQLGKDILGSVKAGAKGGAEFEVGMGINKKVKEKALNTPKAETEQLMKEGAVGVLNFTTFSLLSGILGATFKTGSSALLKSPWLVESSTLLNASKNKQEYLDIAKQQFDKGVIDNNSYTQIKNNIEKAAEISSKTKFIDANGRPLPENKKAVELGLRMQLDTLEKSKSDSNPPALNEKIDAKIKEINAALESNSGVAEEKVPVYKINGKEVSREDIINYVKNKDYEKSETGDKIEVTYDDEMQNLIDTIPGMSEYEWETGEKFKDNQGNENIITAVEENRVFVQDKNKVQYDANGNPILDKTTGKWINKSDIPEQKDETEVKPGDKITTTRTLKGTPTVVEGKVDEVNVDEDGIKTFTLTLSDGNKFITDQVTKLQPKVAEKTAEKVVKKTEVPETKTELPETSQIVAEGTTEDELVQKAVPVTDEMVNIEREVSNYGYEIDTDYDNGIIITDKNGEIVDEEDLPDNVKSLASDYEKATRKLGEIDPSGKVREKALNISRKVTEGEAEVVSTKTKETTKTSKDLAKILEPTESKLIKNAHGDKAYNYVNKDGVEVTLKEDEEGGYVNGNQVQADVHLDFIGNDTKRGEGLSSKELDRIIAEADKNNMSISLVVDSDQAIRGTESKKGLSDQELKKWYESKGFIFDKDSRFGYRPRATEDPSIYKKPKYIAKDGEITKDNIQYHSSPEDLQEAFDQDRLQEGTFHEDGDGYIYKMEGGKLKEVKNVKYVPYENNKFVDKIVYEPIQPTGEKVSGAAQTGAEVPEGEKTKAGVPAGTEPVSTGGAEAPKPVLAKEGDVVELPAQVTGGLPRKMIFKDGEWKQKVGDQNVSVGENIKKQAQAEFDKQKTISSQNETAKVQPESTGDGTGREGTRVIAPLEGAPSVPGINGPDPQLVTVAEKYAKENGIPLKRQSEYATVDENRATRIADEYEKMEHDPQNPKVKEAYQNLIKQTIAQYKALVDAGYKFWFIDTNIPQNAEYASSPYNALRDARQNKQMGVFPTTDGFGSNETIDVSDNPLMVETGFYWPVGGLDGKKKPVLANDLFRAVHDMFGHGLEGAGFRARGEENAWQAHVRLYTGSAVGAITSETRGQNSWLNFGPHGEKNQKAKVEDTIFADQKTGLMPEWTWTEGRVGDMKEVKPETPKAPVTETQKPEVPKTENKLLKHLGIEPKPEVKFSKETTNVETTTKALENVSKQNRINRYNDLINQKKKIESEGVNLNNKDNLSNIDNEIKSIEIKNKIDELNTKLDNVKSNKEFEKILEEINKLQSDYKKINKTSYEGYEPSTSKNKEVVNANSHKEIAEAYHEALKVPEKERTEQQKQLIKSINEALENIKFSKKEKDKKEEEGRVLSTQNEIENKIVDEMNQMNLVNNGIDLSSQSTTTEKIDVKELNSRLETPLATINWKDYEGIPFGFTISDQLRSGNVVNPETGKTIDNLKGGLGFNGTEGNQDKAWANTTQDEGQGMFDKANEIYQKNKALFDRLWKEKKLPDGLIPFAIVKMAESSILSNEAVNRVAIQNIETLPLKNRKNAVKILAKTIKERIVTEKNGLKKGVDKDGKPYTENTIKAKNKKIKQYSKILDVLKKYNHTDIVDVLKDNSHFSLPEKALINNEILYGQPNVHGTKSKKPGIPSTPVSVALLKGLPPEKRSLINLGSITDLLTEPSTKNIPSMHITGIVGVDVKNGGVVTTNHPNYKWGVKGKSIGVLKNPIHMKDAFGEAYGNVISQVVKNEGKNSSISTSSATSQGIPVQSGLVNRIFRGAIAKGKLDDIDKLTGYLRTVFPNTTFFTTQTAWDNAMQDPNVIKHMKDGEVVYGFTKDGNVFLNPNLKNTKVSLHETGHIWFGYIKDNHPELHQKGLSLVTDTKEHDNAKEQYGDTELAKEEALMNLIATKGDTIVNAAKRAEFKEWLLTVYKYVAEKFASLLKLSPKEIENLSLEKFIEGALADILSGKELGTVKPSKEVKKSSESIYNSIKNFIENERKSGVSDAQIRKEIEDASILQPDLKLDKDKIDELMGTKPTEVPIVKLTKADIQRQVDELSMLPAQRWASVSDKELSDLADDAIDNGYDVPNLINELRSNPNRVPSKLEVRILNKYAAALNADMNLRPSKETLKRYTEALDAARKGFSEAGATLRQAQIGEETKDNLSNFLLEKQEAQGAKLTEEQIVEETKKYQELKKAKDELETKLNALRDQYNQLAAQVGANKAKAQMKNQAKKSSAEYKAERTKSIADAKKALEDLRNGKTGAFSTIPGVNELIAIAPHVKKYMSSLIGEGIDNLDTIITNIHAEFKDVLVGLSPKNIRDIIAGEYDVPTGTRNELAAKKRLLEREAQLLNELEAAMKGEEKATTTKQKVAANRRIEELQAKIKEVRALNKEVPDPVEPTNQELLAKKKKELLRKIDKLNKDLREGNYGSEPSPTPKIPLDAETIALMNRVAELENTIRIDRERDEYDKKSKFIKGYDKVMEVLGLKRIIQSAFDLSVSFRQGGTLFSPRNIGTWLKSFKNQLSSVFSESNFTKLMYEIRHSEYFHDMEKDGITFNDMDAIVYNKRNEDFQNSFIFKVPVIKEPLLASQRAADGFLNTARFELYMKMRRNLERKGITRQSDPKSYEDIAKWVMAMTGRGNLAKMFEKNVEAQKFLGNTFYGARLMASRFILLNPATYIKMDKPARVEALKDIFSFAGTVMATGAALAAGGAIISLDPDDPEFLQAKFGDKVYDISAGTVIYIRTALRILKSVGKTVSGDEKASAYGRKTGESTVNFFANKLSPNTKYVWDMAFKGDRFDPYDAVELYPMYSEDVVEALKDEGAISLATVLLPNILGIGYQNYSKNDESELLKKYPNSKGIKFYQNNNIALPEIKNLDKMKVIKDEKHPEGKLTPEDMEKYSNLYYDYNIEAMDKVAEVLGVDTKVTEEQASELRRDINELASKLTNASMMKGKAYIKGTIPEEDAVQFKAKIMRTITKDLKVK